MGVHGDADRLVAGSAAARAASASALAALAAGDGDPCAGERQPPGDRLADAAVAAGHEGGAAAQVEAAGEEAGVVGAGSGFAHPVSPSAGRR